MADSRLLVNLVLALGVAALGAMAAARLGQSVILGYIVAGIAIGARTPGSIGDVATVEAMADIGVILLMFAIGVELSLRDLLRVGKVAMVGGVLQILGVAALGMGVGLAFDWRPLEAVYFGVAITISSSALLGKVLAEHGEVGAEPGRIALGWAAVQDLSLIVIVVVLSSLNAGGERLLRTVALDTAKAALFLIVAVPIGYRTLPLLFERVAALRNREVFVLAVAAFALGVAYLASLFGLSAALGAFVAGVVVSESDLAHQILGAVVPLRDIFAGLFFVSAGMMVDPLYVARHLPLVLLAVGLVVIAKGAISSAVTVALRYPLRTALLVGVSLAQAGEFSFLLARLGAGAGVVSTQVFNLIMAAAVVSIVLAPPLYRLTASAARRLERRVPEPASAAAMPRDTGMRGHTIICGYGRVGRLIGAALRRRDFRIVVIEQNRDIVARLREDGVVALLGSADNPILLDRAGLGQARVLVVAIPDALATRQVVDYALQVNPSVQIIVRVHSEIEREFMDRRPVSAVVMGEQELALEMTRQTLRRYGVSALEALAIVQRLRGSDEDEGAIVGISTDH